NGLGFMRGRFYTVAEGRFLNPDPIRFAGGDVNLQRYARNSPTNSSDPRGTAAIPVPPIAIPVIVAAGTLILAWWVVTHQDQISQDIQDLKDFIDHLLDSPDFTDDPTQPNLPRPGDIPDMDPGDLPTDPNIPQPSPWDPPGPGDGLPTDPGIPGLIPPNPG